MMREIIHEELTKAWKLSTELEFKAFGKEDGIPEGGFFGSGQVDGCRARCVEGEASLRLVPKVVRAFWVMRFHCFLPVRRSSVCMGEVLDHIRRPKCRVRKRESIFQSRRGGPGLAEAGNRE